MWRHHPQWMLYHFCLNNFKLYLWLIGEYKYVCMCVYVCVCDETASILICKIPWRLTKWVMSKDHNKTFTHWSYLHCRPNFNCNIECLMVSYVQGDKEQRKSCVSRDHLSLLVLSFMKILFFFCNLYRDVTMKWRSTSLIYFYASVRGLSFRWSCWKSQLCPFSYTNTILES